MWGREQGHGQGDGPTPHQGLGPSALAQEETQSVNQQAPPEDGLARRQSPGRQPSASGGGDAAEPQGLKGRGPRASSSQHPHTQALATSCFSQA